MTSWRFSDGTIVHLGGEVEGSSLFAQELRRELEQPDLEVQIWPHPNPGVPLDRNDLALLDTWLHLEMERPFRAWLGLGFLERPENIPPLPPPPADDDQGATPDDLVN
jgi:hypothetical protein